VQRLSQDEGVNLAGVKRIIELERTVDELRAQLAELIEELAVAQAAAEQAAASVHASYRRDLVPVKRHTTIAVWRPTPNNPPTLTTLPRRRVGLSAQRVARFVSPW